jgi:D-amino-acid dehydrogenase
MKSSDVVVVGAGAIGAATAYELARAGARVTVLERSGAADGCSHGNAGLICPSHAEALANPAAVRDGLRWLARRDSPFHLRPRIALLPWLARFGLAALPRRSRAATETLRALATASLARHAALADEGVATSFTRRGILSVFESPRAVARLNGSALSPEQARALEPALAGIAGAVFHPGEAHCDPSAFVGALLAAARAHGADVRPDVELLRLRRSNGRIAALETTHGTLRAGTVVLAAGSWTAALARPVGVHVPVEPAKGYHVELAAAPLRAGIPIYMEEARVIATPLGDRVRLAGTLELSGMDDRVDPVRVQALVAAAERTLRLPRSAPRVHVWRGLRPCAPDGLPVIGRPDGLENLVLATGHAMLGVTLAPVTGEIVTSLVAGRPPAHDIMPLSPSRFRIRRR